ncbi:hypothetical protein COCC4DRAFT_198937 [Bipolaris maydis ATCC 48331]|uniref:Cell wall hydroxyproline-rich glycoprotein n=2 Tax=Cochliobolus heterostrophus TaxID=5016 RepID=M2UFX9_COCH5|nr:uncharacterized protein COCC4DRAFT_198937 [Bipolaris maydis ATCC 48331]EMD86878.1 hypothetical protein COCHEDRAFT_1185105 [Bipolaris maydis C5]ENI04125.1 hypothetical protein COCC4DRAFT_198937 [Bipolaris maydis ATCC 48331]KAJ6204213.1 hypothetical protein PSV09DRAFT_1185105 [Bipolaris maydis]KAJ6265867.1 hypothetical protein PSV08DRAFT_232338 [Bipolaris maydis]
MLSLIVSSLIALAQAAPHQPVQPQKAAALPANLVRDLATAVAFRKTVTGPQEILANWTGSDVCQWEGFTCAQNPDTGVLTLASIDFNDLHLTGNIKLNHFVENFPDLALIHVNNNSFSGSVPNLKNFKYLYEVDISENKFSGSFPLNVLSNSGLFYLDIGNNQFNGPLPSNLMSSLPNLEVLFVRVNRFNGVIPDILTKAMSLQGLSFATNNLTGTIPVGFGLLPNLTAVDFSYNSLTGTVPEDLCASKSIQYISVAGNKLDPNLGPECQKAKAKGILIN